MTARRARHWSSAYEPPARAHQGPCPRPRPPASDARGDAGSRLAHNPGRARRRDAVAETISRQFAHWAANLTYDDLPPEVADKIKALLLQGLASAVFGSQTAMGRLAVELAKAEEAKPDGATILTDGSKATRVGAAFANAALVTYSGLWDSYRMLTHPALMLIPAAIVNAELEHRSGKEIITALTAGYELLCRMSEDFTPSTAAHGFRCSMIYGALASAVVTGKLLGLDEDGLVSAIGIATHFASGLYE